MTGQIGPYQVISELGQGGMGMVFRALQPSVNRIVALKVLPSHLETDETSVRRFQQEAETAANLTHESIVKVWEASLDRPPYYIALEFLEGGTLAERLTSGPLPLEEAIGILARVCMALDHAHQRGVVHRDIKPANIMFDGASKPVVTDFGIARAAEHTRLTMTGAKFGTPDYMSPEQAKGLRVDHRSDLYSVAVVLYEMLTGRPPFSNEEPLVTMNQIVNEPTPSPRVFNAALSPGIEAVLMRALAKSPDERFQSGTEFVQALWTACESPETNIPSIPTPARPASTVGLASSPSVAAVSTSRAEVVPLPGITPRRRSLLIGLLSAILICIVGIAAFYIIRSRGAATAPTAGAPVVTTPLPVSPASPGPTTAEPASVPAPSTGTPTVPATTAQPHPEPVGRPTVSPAPGAASTPPPAVRTPRSETPPRQAPAAESRRPAGPAARGSAPATSTTAPQPARPPAPARTGGEEREPETEVEKPPSG